MGASAWPGHRFWFGPGNLFALCVDPQMQSTPLLPTEVLFAPAALCSSQNFGLLRSLGTGLGDRFTEAGWSSSAVRGNKKGHLLAFREAL
jgi:hypothetical protein